MVVHRRYNPESITAYNIVPGLLGVILSMTLVMMTALGVTRERERGTMESLLATPVRPAGGDGRQAGALRRRRPDPDRGDPDPGAAAVRRADGQGGWLAPGAAGVLLFIVGSLALGFLISTAARTQLQAMQMSFFYMLPSILLSGFMFPFRGMPELGPGDRLGHPGDPFPAGGPRRPAARAAGMAESWPSLAALLLFVLVVTALAMARYRTTLD